MDMLEGHPEWYRREKKPVLVTGLDREGFSYHNAILEPWVYMAPDDYYSESETLYEEY